MTDGVTFTFMLPLSSWCVIIIHYSFPLLGCKLGETDDQMALMICIFDSISLHFDDFFDLCLGTLGHDFDLKGFSEKPTWYWTPILLRIAMHVLIITIAMQVVFSPCVQSLQVKAPIWFLHFSTTLLRRFLRKFNKER